MNEAAVLMFSAIVGGALGAFFFGGLWWTVTRGASAKHPALLFLASLLVRTSVVLSGLYFTSGGHLGRLLACLLGFTLLGLVAKPMGAPAGIEERTNEPGAADAP